MQRCREAPAHRAPLRRSDLGEGDRAAGLSLTIQIVADYSRRIAGTHDSLVAGLGQTRETKTNTALTARAGDRRYGGPSP
jgi:hypothetical protein